METGHEQGIVESLFAIQFDNKLLKKVANSLSRNFIEFWILRHNSSNANSFGL